MINKSIPAWLLLLPLSPMAMAQPAAEAPPVDIFAVRSWEPPPVAAEIAVETAPQAPPLPFRFLGRIVEADRRPAYLLADGARVVVARVGDPIGADYRVEKYQNGQLLFRYRPMNLRQALDVGEKK